MMATTTEQYIARPYAGEADLPAITDLLNDCDAVDHLEDNYALDDLRIEFADPRLDPTNDLRLWEDADGTLVAFGQVWIDKMDARVEGGLYFRVAPAARGSSIEDDVMTWVCARIRGVANSEGKPAHLRYSTRADYAYGHILPQRYGMIVTRHFFQMRRPLNLPIEPALLPTGFTLRHVANDADITGWVEAYNLSFIDHWNFHPRTEEAHRHWMQHPSYQPHHDLIAVAADGTIAAYCYCIIDPAENARNQRNDGLIGILGTRRGYRKQGLGRAMLLAGLHRLKADGMTYARLNVDAENPSGALQLYESVGFNVIHSWQNHELNLT